MVTGERGVHTQVRIGGLVIYVPRHGELNENSAKAILQQIGDSR